MFDTQKETREWEGEPVVSVRTVKLALLEKEGFSRRPEDVVNIVDI